MSKTLLKRVSHTKYKIAFNNEARVYYAEAENTISKKELFELALFLCDAKLNNLDSQKDTLVSKDDLLQIKSQLCEKLKAHGG